MFCHLIITTLHLQDKTRYGASLKVAAGNFDLLLCQALHASCEAFPQRPPTDECSEKKWLTNQCSSTLIPIPFPMPFLYLAWCFQIKAELEWYLPATIMLSYYILIFISYDLLSLSYHLLSSLIVVFCYRHYQHHWLNQLISSVYTSMPMSSMSVMLLASIQWHHIKSSLMLV